MSNTLLAIRTKFDQRTKASTTSTKSIARKLLAKSRSRQEGERKRFVRHCSGFSELLCILSYLCVFPLFRHKIDKDFMDSVPSMVQKSQAFHQTLRNGFTTFPTITQVITRAIESVEKANNSLASLRPSFDK